MKLVECVPNVSEGKDKAVIAELARVIESVAGTRLAPVTANSIATINRLAPSRTFLGIGTGNTAMRLMGHKPMRLREFGDYLRVLRGLLRGEEVDFTWQGQTLPVQFLMQDHKFIDVEHPIPIYVSGFGYPVVPQGQARLRCQVSAAHERKDLDCAVDAFRQVGKKFGVI